MGTDILAFWSLVAFIIRLLAILVFIYLLIVQFKELRKPATNLRPLARLLFHFFIIIIVTSIPLLYLNYIRIQGGTASPGVTSVATVTNAIGLFGAALMLLLIYKYKGKDE